MKRIAHRQHPARERIVLTRGWAALLMAIALWGPAAAAPAATESALFPAVDWSATRLIRAGRYQEALDSLLADSSIADTGVHFLKLGIVHSRMTNDKEALFYLRFSAQKNPNLSSIAYEMIGDIEQRRGRAANAVLAYRAALESPFSETGVLALHRKIYSVLKTDSTLAAQISWFSEITSGSDAVAEDWIPDFLDTLISAQKWHLVDSVLDQFSKSDEPEKACGVIGVVQRRAIPDSVLSTRRIFSISVLSLQCRKNREAELWLKRAQDRKDFNNSISKKEYLGHAGRLNYRLGNHTKCIKLLEAFETKYGLSPEVVLTLARAYRAVGKRAKSDLWYDRHIDLYPTSPGTYEIIWYRAWQFEEDGKYREALKRFQILAAKKGFTKADQASFRVGLCYHRMGVYDSARIVFSNFQKKYPRSSSIAAAEYWRAKTLLELKKEKEAAEIFLRITRTEPTGYYAYRSREMLRRGGDSAISQTVVCVDASMDPRQWLDSISRRDTLSIEDSSRFVLSLILSSIGMAERANTHLDGLATKYPGNLALQYDISRLYRICGNPTLSYRVGRRLAWRIPPEHRSFIPPQVYSILYPAAFDAAVEKSARQSNLDPYLVYSVMRQESIFDPKIVSPAGAVGLMQIMPFTGEEIARELGEEFNVTTLTEPSTNVRYGTHYLARLLEQFEGNLVLAIAGYNGGPHNAKKWHARNKDASFDLSVEDIGFTETREYVKKVLANYWTYQVLASAAGLSEI